MIPQLGSIGPGFSPPVDIRPDPPEVSRPNRVEPLTGGRETADLPTLPERASDRALEVARLNRPDQRDISAGEIGQGDPVGDPVVDSADLNPPDPDAPTGPPPAFEASILDRARETALAPPAADPAADFAAPVVSGDPESTTAETKPSDSAGSNPYSAPPTAETRASEEIATLRRMETPYDTATVDVSR